ncbi:MAG: sirohydrochlorin chelatase [Actinomycetes bacterium]
MPDTAWILIAHGSRRPESATEHAALCDAVSEAAGTPVAPAYLELAEPSIPTAVDRAVADGATRVVLLPYFLHPGNHVREDLPRIAQECRDAHPGVDIGLRTHVGADPRLVGLLASLVADGPVGPT